MSNMGCCGMDCDACESRRATVSGDNEALARIAASSESSGHGSFILPSRVRCTGCLAAGAKSVTCNECRVRLCAMENQMPSCAFCDEFPCDLGNEIWEAAPEYKHNLKVLRSR